MCHAAAGVNLQDQQRHSTTPSPPHTPFLQAFNFHDVATNKPIKAAKSAALNCNKTGDHFEAAVGDEYIYEADGKRYTVKIADISLGDGK